MLKERCDVFIVEHLVADEAILDELSSLSDHGDVALDDVTEEVADNVELLSDLLVLSQELLHSGREVSLIDEMLEVVDDIHDDVLDPVEGLVRELNELDFEGAVHLREQLVSVTMQGVLDDRQLVLEGLDELLTHLGAGEVQAVRLNPLVVIDPRGDERNRAVVVLFQGRKELMEDLLDLHKQLVDGALVVGGIQEAGRKVLELSKDGLLILDILIVGLDQISDLGTVVLNCDLISDGNEFILLGLGGAGSDEKCSGKVGAHLENYYN